MLIVPQNLRSDTRFIIWTGGDLGKIILFQEYKIDQYNQLNGNPRFLYGEDVIFPLWKNIRRLTPYTFLLGKLRAFHQWLIPYWNRYITGTS